MTEPAEYQPESQPQPAPLPPAIEHLLAMAESLHAMLAACLPADGSPPDVEAVHQLRTGTRRVEATLETLSREAGARGLGRATEDARQRWLRQLTKVRRASGAVRDLDVHRELLAKHYLPDLRGSADDTSAQDAAVTAAANAGATAMKHPSRGVALMEQAHTLDRWLAARRTDATGKLKRALSGRVRRLREAEQAFTAAFLKRRSAVHHRHRPAALRALEDYLRLMDAMPHLDAENLHDFRKGAKKARYVAEAGGDDPAAVATTRAIKRVQDAIGDWHDWEVLAEESRDALGRDSVALEHELDQRVQQAYHRALRTVETMGRRFVGEWQAVRRTSRPASLRRKTISN